MQVKIRIDRAAAIRAGRDSFGDTIVTVNPSDLTPDEREALLAAPVTAGAEQIPDLPNASGNVWPGKYPEPPALADADDGLAVVKAWLAWRAACKVERARVAAEAQAQEAAALAKAMTDAEQYVSYWRDQPAERFTRWAAGDGMPRGTADEPVPPWVTLNGNSEPERMVKEALAGKLAEAREILAARKLEQEEAKAKAEQAKAESDARRAAQLEAWVRDHGSENQQGRFKLGLLPEQEVLDAIRSESYSSLDAFQRYRKIRLDDLDHGEECYEGALDCETEPANALSAAEYDAFAEIQKAAPAGATLEALAHSCTCSSCGAGLIRRSVRVGLKVGELTFSREYAFAD
jgi:hypothetical protein